MGTDGTILIPPRRLGALLREARLGAGRDLAELAADCDLTVVDLDDLEQGRVTIDDVLLARLVELYGVEDASLVPERSKLVIDLDEGRIAVHDAADPELVGPDGPGSDGTIPHEIVAPDLVLARYLALVYRLRDLPLGTSVPLRDVDLAVLAAALELPSADVESRLERLMADEEAVGRDQRRISRRLLLPLVGVVIAVTSVGAVLLVSADDPDPAPPAATTAVVTPAAPSIGDAVVVEAPTSVPTEIGDAAVQDGPPG
jgi:transcriptional regulator with XRE-family HTH domain